MSYRKLKADYLFDGHKMLDTHAVLICRQDGVIEAVVEEEQAGTDLEKFSGLISPGFINSHCHMELSHLKNRIPEREGLVNFLLSVINHRMGSAEQKREAILSAELEMLNGGIVAVGDICNTADTLVPKSAKRLAYYNFIELLGWAPGQAPSRYEAGEKLAAIFSEMDPDENHLSLNPHAPYSVSENLWNLMMPGFRDKTITIHNQESAAENEFFLTGKGDLARFYSILKMDTTHFMAPGATGPSVYLPKLKTASGIILVHNTYMDETALKESLSVNDNLFFCLCPNANLYIENRLPDIPMFQKNNVRIVLGTDSLASNRQLSILEEMKAVKKNYPLTPTSHMLKWATSDGAKALSFEETLGNFSAGKKPGIVLIDHVHDGEITELSTSRRIL